VALLPSGLEIRRPLSADEYAGLGAVLRLIDEARQWWWGDWLVYGERYLGETYAQYADLAGYEPKTLQNWAYVASHVDPSLRRDDLTWSHHALVAALEPDDQRRVLGQAAGRRLSVRETRALLAGPGPSQPSTQICPACGGTGRIACQP
jgi:hypothetical protein